MLVLCLPTSLSAPANLPDEGFFSLLERNASASIPILRQTCCAVALTSKQPSQGG